jgi:hypothetical protein
MNSCRLMGSLIPNVTRYHIVVWNAELCITANLAANVSAGQTLTSRPTLVCLLPVGADMTPRGLWAPLCH